MLVTPMVDLCHARWRRSFVMTVQIMKNNMHRHRRAQEHESDHSKDSNSRSTH